MRLIFRKIQRDHWFARAHIAASIFNSHASDVRLALKYQFPVTLLQPHWWRLQRENALRWEDRRRLIGPIWRRWLYPTGGEPPTLTMTVEERVVELEWLHMHQQEAIAVFQRERPADILRVTKLPERNHDNI